MAFYSNKKGSAASDAQAGQGITYYLARFNPFQFHKRGKRARALAALAVVCFFWGTTWVASKQGVAYMPALQLAGLRQFTGGCIYVLFFMFKGVAFPRRKDWGGIFILTFLNFIMSNGLSTWGVAYIPAGLASIIGSIFPLWLVIIMMIGSHTRFQSKTLLGIFLGFTGICVIFYEHLNDFLDPEFRFGIFLSLVSTWTWAFGTLYTKKHAARFNPYFGLGIQMVISGFSLYTVSVITGHAVPLNAIPWQAWSAITYLVVFGSVISFIAYLYALAHLPTEQASLYAYINPIVAVLLGSFFFGEKLTLFILAGAFITLYGVYLVNRAAMKLN